MYRHIKYLEIIIDEVLSWNKQIESICMKLARANSILFKLCYFVPKDICISVYYSLFYTHLIYGCFVSRKTNINRLIKLQNRCIRIINFSDFDCHTDPQYSELKLLKVSDIFSLSKFFYMLDFIKENIPEDPKRLFFFNKSVNSFETCSSLMFHISKWKTSWFGSNTLSYDGAKLWNKFCHAFLHKETDLTKSKFKNLLKIHFPNTYAWSPCLLFLLFTILLQANHFVLN